MATKTNTKTTDTKSLLTELSTGDLHRFLGTATSIRNGLEDDLSAAALLELLTGPCDDTSVLLKFLEAANTAAVFITKLGYREVTVRNDKQRRGSGGRSLHSVIDQLVEEAGTPQHISPAANSGAHNDESNWFQR